MYRALRLQHRLWTDPGRRWPSSAAACVVRWRPALPVPPFGLPLSPAGPQPSRSSTGAHRPPRGAHGPRRSARRSALWPRLSHRWQLAHISFEPSRTAVGQRRVTRTRARVQGFLVSLSGGASRFLSLTRQTHRLRFNGIPTIYSYALAGCLVGTPPARSYIYSYESLLPFENDIVTAVSDLICRFLAVF